MFTYKLTYTKVQALRNNIDAIRTQYGKIADLIHHKGIGDYAYISINGGSHKWQSVENILNELIDASNTVAANGFKVEIDVANTLLHSGIIRKIRAENAEIRCQIASTDEFRAGLKEMIEVEGV